MPDLMKLDFGNIFADALVCDEGNKLLFAGLYGRNADIQALLASMTLKQMASLPFHRNYRTLKVQYQGVTLSKKITKVTTKSYGVLDQLFLFNPQFNQLDHETKTSWLIADSEEQMQRLLWGTIKNLSQIPLLSHWQETILDTFSEAVQSPKLCAGPVHVKHVHLPDDFEERVSSLVKSFVLTVQ